jgi:hypothetical protein
MDNTALIKDLLGKIQKSDFDGAAAMLTADFMFSGATPEPVPGMAWLGLHRAMNAACPDFAFNLKSVQAEGDMVHASVALSGTQSNALDLTGAGMMVIPPSGKHFQLPTEMLVFGVMNGKATGLQVMPAEGGGQGGLPGILGQLGVDMSH